MASVSLKEALELFPEVRPELPRLLEERTAELLAQQTRLTKLDALTEETVNKLWKERKYQQAIGLEIHVDKCPFRQTVRALQLQVYAYETALNKRDSVAQDEINSAKRYPMEMLLPANSRHKGRYHLCPFHKEKTPSFHIHKDNRYTCFGCNKHGDTISLVMELYNLNFKSAVRAINHYGVL